MTDEHDVSGSNPVTRVPASATAADKQGASERWALYGIMVVLLVAAAVVFSRPAPARQPLPEADQTTHFVRQALVTADDNLLSQEQHRFDGAGTSGWIPQGNTEIRTSDGPAVVGDRVLRVDVSADGPFPDASGTARVGTAAGSGSPSATAGVEYSGSVQTTPLGTATTVRCELRWYAADGSILATNDSGPLTQQADTGWTTHTCSGVAPSDTTHVGLRVFIQGASYGDVHLVDNASLVAADSGESTPPQTAAPTEPPPATEPPPGGDPAPPPPLDATWEEAYQSGDLDVIRAWFGQNTGIAHAGLTEADLTLTSTMTTSRDGQVIDGMLVRGNIRVMHDDVTIRNTKITGSGDWYAIYVAAADRELVNSLTVENVSIEGFGCAGGSDPKCETAILTWPGNQLTADRVNIRGHSGGIRLNGGARITYTSVQDIQTYAGSHNTAMSTRGGTDYAISRSFLEGSTSSALALYSDATISYVDVSEVVFDGGGYSFNGGDNKAAGDSLNNIRFTDNRFTRNHSFGPVTNWCDDCPGNVWSNNSYLDGEVID